MFTKHELNIIEVLIVERRERIKEELDKKLGSPEFIQGLESYLRYLNSIYDKITNVDLI